MNTWLRVCVVFFFFCIHLCVHSKVNGWRSSIRACNYGQIVSEMNCIAYMMHLSMYTYIYVHVYIFFLNCIVVVFLCCHFTDVYLFLLPLIMFYMPHHRQWQQHQELVSLLRSSRPPTHRNYFTFHFKVFNWFCRRDKNRYFYWFLHYSIQLITVIYFQEPRN